VANRRAVALPVFLVMFMALVTVVASGVSSLVLRATSLTATGHDLVSAIVVAAALLVTLRPRPHRRGPGLSWWKKKNRSNALARENARREQLHLQQRAQHVAMLRGGNLAPTRLPSTTLRVFSGQRRHRSERTRRLDARRRCST
jgi:hypothetical protein